MNALKTFVNQIETFGKFISEYKYGATIERRYRIDTVTTAVVFYTKDNKPKHASFIYQ